MNYVISVYSQDAYKEYLLPAVNNTDISIILYKDMFKLEKDITLTLETLNSQWFFSKNQEYDLVCQNQADESGEDSPAASDGMLRDKELWMLISKQGRRLSILVRITRFSFYPYEKYRILNPSILIGYSPRADIVYNSMKTISKEHARLEYRNQECTLYDMSKNGVYINELRVHEKQVLQFGDFINVLGCHMVYLGGYLAIDLLQSGAKVNPDKLRLESSDGMGNIPDSAQAEAEENAGTIFHRVPRNMDPIIENEIEIEPPPNEQKLKQRSLLLTIGPSMTMAIPMMLGCLLAVYASRQNGGTSSVFMYTGLVTAISAALIGSIWGIVNLRSAKKENEKEKKKRQKAYEEYLQEQERKIQLCFEQNKAVLQKMYPSALTSSTYDDKSLYLWNRNITHRDFLYERIGIGILPFQCEIKVAKPRFTVEKDPLADHPQTIKNRYSYLSEVPVGIDLKKQQLIGVIGGREKKGAFQISRILLTQIAANNCYTDVKICVVYNHKNSVEAQSMDCIKWLPHVWSADRKVRYVADNQLDMTEVFYELASVIRSRAENKSDRGDNILPYYVLVVTDPKQLEGELISKYLLHPKEEYGITTILLAERYEDLPNSCEYIIQNDTYFQGMYSVGTQKNDQESIAFDHIDEKTMETFARKLSRIEVNQLETGGEIPNVLSFFDMYGIKNIDDLQIENRWRKNRNYDSMRALIGQKSGGADCYLDIHEKYHGPHGVIAGTTGSGKSETLQTFMLSLAINFSPDDVGFFIIDYKGGGLANQFEKLPHLMGNISNLSGNQVHRAMVSIKSENRRRQRLFNENGVNNINQYTHLYKDGEIKTPIPHLLIVIDEFAELKNEEPDFMKELISVAQVGRSLGVHLILATQKPNGVVDDNIRSNAKFRLCLRVQDRQDSTDMLHKPDAAYITQAGRGYLQVGNDELYELFQSGYSGAEYENYADNGNAETAKMLSMTGKTALIGSRNKIRRKEQLRKQWIKDIVEAVEKQLCEMALTSQELKDGSAFSEKFFDAIFSFLQEKGYTFARSEHNLHKLGEFLMLYQQSMDEHVLSGEKMAVDIMERAARKGIALPEYKAKSQLDAVVEHIERLAVSAGYHEQFKLWLPVLSRKICLKELDDLYEEESVNESPDRNWKGQNGQRGLEVCVGLADDPENQAQMPVSVDFLNYGHHVICGTAGSGKSTFLQTLLYALIVKYSPEEVNLYGIDFSSHVMSAFETAPHVGGIMYENDLDKIAKFFHMIEKMVEERKQILKGGNYQQYIKTYGVKLPAIIIAIDQYAGFREKTGNSYEKNIMKLSREASAFGVYLVVTAGGFGMTELPNRIAENFRKVICLEMADRYQYSDVLHTIHFDVLPETGVKGRGLIGVEERLLEFQTALPVEAKDDYSRIEKIAGICEKMKASWSGKQARRIPEIPKNPIMSEFIKLPEVQKHIEDPQLLPIGYDMKNAEIYDVDLSRTYCYLISGKARTGKSNLLRVCMMAAKEKEANICVIDTSGSLEKTARELGARYVQKDSELFAFLKDMIPIFRERNQKKKELVRQNLEDTEIFAQMSQTNPWFIFIDNMKDFIHMALNPSEGVGDMKGFLENISEKGSLHNIYFFAGINQDDNTAMAGKKLYENMAGYRCGIHLGGNTNMQRIFSFDYLSYTMQSKSVKAGTGYIPTEMESETQMAAIPLAR